MAVMPAFFSSHHICVMTGCREHISMSRPYNEHSKKPGLRRAFLSPPVRTPYAIHLLRTYSKVVMTFERSRNYWDTMM
jgi:hypothetical protein